MKYIIIIIKPEKREAILEELRELGITRFVMSEVRGYGGELQEARFRVVTYTTTDAPRLKIEIAAVDEFVEKIISVVEKLAKHEEVSGGKIFVLPLHECVRSRTGERGDAAINS